MQTCLLTFKCKNQNHSEHYEFASLVTMFKIISFKRQFETELFGIFKDNLSQLKENKNF